MQVAKYDDQLGTNETHFSLVIKVFVRQMLEEITTFNEINDKQNLGVTLIGIMQLNHVWTFGIDEEFLLKFCTLKQSILQN